MNNFDFFLESEFLIPYYKQFIKLLTNDKVLLLERETTNASSFLEHQNLKVHHELTCEKFDGVILNNYLSKLTIGELETFIINLKNSLTSEGIVLLINNNMQFNKTKTDYLFQKDFEEIETLIGDEKWNFILYKKRTTK